MTDPCGTRVLHLAGRRVVLLVEARGFPAAELCHKLTKLCPSRLFCLGSLRWLKPDTTRKVGMALLTGLPCFQVWYDESMTELFQIAGMSTVATERLKSSTRKVRPCSPRW